MNIYDTISRLLTEQNKTQKELSDYLGLAQSRVSDWKSGRVKSYTKYVDKIAGFFNVSSDYLLGADEIKNRATSEDMERIYKIMQEDPEIKEYVELYQKLSPEGKKKMQMLLDLMLHGDNESKA